MAEPPRRSTVAEAAPSNASEGREDDEFHECDNGLDDLPRVPELANSVTMPVDRLALLQTHGADVAELRAAVCETVGQLEATPQRVDALQLDDQSLLAYLRASGFSVRVAQERLVSSWVWRRESDVDAKLSDEAWRAAERDMRQILLYDYLGPDRHGRPVLVERVGAWNVDDVIRASDDIGRFCHLHAMASETLAKMPRPAGTVDLRGYSMIMDMTGLGVRHLRSRLATVFGAVNDIDEKHFPDSVANIFVVNAPRLFSALFSMVRPILNEDTYAKVHCSSGIPSEMLEELGPECLPVELGGTLAMMFPYHLSTVCSKNPELST